MEFVGRYTIAAPPESVWAALNDADVLKACIPGCESLNKTDDAHFVGAARLKIGPLNATFKGAVTMSDMDPPHRCILTGEGQGGVAGFAKGSAEIQLAAVDAGTDLTYAAKANVGGKLAQIGQRLIDGAARQIADDFFARFSAQVATMQPPAAPTATGVLAPPPSVPEETDDGESRTREGVAPEVWVIGLIAVIVILLALFGLVL